jgi:threonine dehydratase
VEAPRPANLGDLDLSIDRIDTASRLIDPVFRDTPQYIDDQLCAALGRRVIVKVETANPVRSFKGRGTDFLLTTIEKHVKHVVCASAGNFGQGIAYGARARGMKADVFAPAGISPSKLDRIRAFGATVHEAGTTGDEAKAAAAEFAAAAAERVLIEDGREPEIAEGAGTIAVELLHGERPDTIVVPLGDGALITGIARWTKEFDPEIDIVGVVAAGAPAMLHSYRSGRPVPFTGPGTIAEGIDVTTPVPASVTRLLHLVDDIVAVPDDALLNAIRLATTTLGLILEPSGAAGLAALIHHDIPGHTAATILTGSNAHPTHLPPNPGPSTPKPV